jgi:pyruvate,water dikinase
VTTFAGSLTSFFTAAPPGQRTVVREHASTLRPCADRGNRPGNVFHRVLSSAPDGATVLAMTTTERPSTVARATSPTVDLAELDATALALAGGKAANLGELIAAGLPVPPGFCVTTDAYTSVAAGLDGDPATMRAALAAAPVPEEIAEAVTRAYRALGPDVPVAVRSSATAEDLPTASFAGQQDTYLNVVGAGAVLDAVRRCWASLWTDRAVAYRAEAGVDGAVALAVVVQRMVDARAAGVLFTADPVSGRRARTVIDAGPGLGEAVVSGMVNPDHLAVEGDRIVERRLGDKAVAVRALPGGGTERVQLAEGADDACLTDEQVLALVALGRRVEAHFGAPQDVEWALDADGVLWLTQARPITTLYPRLPSRDGALRAYLCASLAQGLTRPITPMGLSGFRVLGSAAARLARVTGPHTADPTAGPPALADAGGRLFVDLTPVIRNRVGRRVALRMLSIMEARAAEVLRALDGPAFAPTSAWRAVRRLLPVLVRLRVGPVLLHAVASPAAAHRRVARVVAEVQAYAPAPPGASAAERLDHATQALTDAFPVLPRIAPNWVAGFVMRGLARVVAGSDLDDVTMDEVLRGLAYNVTTEMDLELWALAQRVRGDADAAAALGTPDAPARFRAGGLPPALQDGLAGFLARHGHRAVAEIDLGMPRWSDDPAHVLGALANYLRLTDPAQAPDARFAAGRQAAEAAVADVVARVRRRSAWRARVVGFALGRVRELVGMRETHKDLLVRLIALARADVAAVGAELAGRGLLAAADDVFFLDLREARAALAGADQRATVAARRADYDRELRRRHVPRVLLSDGTEPEAIATPAAPEDGSLVGTPASAGTVTAPARVVLDPVGAHLEPGEILVAPSTDPGWTPLFLTAGALVMEMGGSNSHGAVVAREYGIPAVVGVPGATARIATGDIVTVDGASGRVRRG